LNNINTQKLRLVFDLDNTLLFRDEAMLACIEAVFDLRLSVLQKIAIRQQDEQGHSDRIHFCKWLQSYLNIAMEVASIWSLIKKNIGRFVTINPSTVRVLSTLQTTYECILLTNGGIENQQKKIAQTKLNTFFPASHIFISESIGYQKPDLKAFQLVQNQFDGTTNFCMIGDHWEKDILGAENAGWYAVHLTATPRSTNRKKITSITSLAMLDDALNNLTI